jgi:hypothetical protein
VDVFDYSAHLNYHYDNLEINSWSLDQLEGVLKKQRSGFDNNNYYRIESYIAWYLSMLNLLPLRDTTTLRSTPGPGPAGAGA